MTDPRQAAEDALTTALREVAHTRKWCKHSDEWHAVAHPEPDYPHEDHGPAIARDLLDASPALTSMLLTGAAVESVGLTPAKVAQGYMRKHGFVIDKWPPGVDRPADHIEDFDTETRWQGLAFSLYADLVEYESAIAAALGDET